MAQIVMYLSMTNLIMVKVRNWILDLLIVSNVCSKLELWIQASTIATNLSLDLRKYSYKVAIFLRKEV